MVVEKQTVEKLVEQFSFDIKIFKCCEGRLGKRRIMQDCQNVLLVFVFVLIQYLCLCLPGGG